MLSLPVTGPVVHSLAKPSYCHFVADDLGRGTVEFCPSGSFLFIASAASTADDGPQVLTCLKPVGRFQPCSEREQHLAGGILVPGLSAWYRRQSGKQSALLGTA